MCSGDKFNGLECIGFLVHNTAMYQRIVYFSPVGEHQQVSLSRKQGEMIENIKSTVGEGCGVGGIKQATDFHQETRVLTPV